MNRATDDIQAVKTGDRKISAYSDAYIPGFGKYLGSEDFSKIEGHPYGAEDAIKNQFVGQTPKIADWISKKQQGFRDKQKAQ